MMMSFRTFVRGLLSLFFHFLAEYPLRSVLTILAIMSAALAEGVGVASLLPLINLMLESEGTKSTSELYIAQAFDSVGLEISIGGLLCVIVVAIVLKSVLVLLSITQAGYLAAHVAMNLRLELVRALLDARWEHFIDQRAGELASVVSYEPMRTANAYVALCRTLAAGLQLAVYVALSFVISWEVSIAALIVGSLGMIALNRFVTLSQRAGSSQTKLQKSFMTRVLQGLDGMKPLKAMGREDRFAPLIEMDVRGLNRAHRTIIVSLEAVAESHEVIRVLAIAGGLYVLLTVWSQPIESLFVLAFLFARTLQKVYSVQSCYQIAAADLPAFTFVRSTITAARSAPEPNPGGETPRLDSAIALRDVSFSYGAKNVLKHVSMVLPVGQFIAIVGASGAGKTTVADLIIGLLRPQHGEVWIDDLPMRDANFRSWRSMIGYVPQETFLFHDTITANVTLGDDGVTAAQVESALRRAEAWDFVTSLPEGTSTVVGERGGRLSGGQRQRIAIARALIRNPALLILDEATTALDPETEAGIVATLQRLAGKVTVLSISHQPAMRFAADVVYCLENGRVDFGDHTNQFAVI